MILVSGYYGFDNLGDDAILDVLCADLLALGIKGEDIVVLSNNPEQTARRLGVVALFRYDLKAIWRSLGKARLFISGGGSLLQDVTSRRSIPYYLGLVELAFIRRVPVVMYGQGLGPVQSNFFRAWVGRAFMRSLACSVRDAGSLQLLLDLGVPEDRIELCADPVFQHELVKSKEPRTRQILLNLRPYIDWDQHQKLWQEQIRLWQKKGFRVGFIPLGPGDLEMGRELQEKCTGLQVHSDLTLDTLRQVFVGVDLCVSMRLHGLIFSALHDCLPIGLNYDPKVEAICQQLEIPFWELDNLAELDGGIDEVLQNAEQHRLRYRRALSNLRDGALRNRAMVARVMR